MKANPATSARDFRRICLKREPTREEVDRYLVWGSSYQRLPMLIDAIPFLDRAMVFEVLGSEWTTVDNIGVFHLPLAKLLRSATRAELDLMMTSDERATLAAMPEAITAYRGCYEINRHGLSWSVNRNVAERFTTLNRYSRPGEQALLLRGIAYRDRAVLKLDRAESEVIAFDVHDVAEVGNGP